MESEIGHLIFKVTKCWSPKKYLVACATVLDCSGQSNDWMPMYGEVDNHLPSSYIRVVYDRAMRYTMARLIEECELRLIIDYLNTVMYDALLQQFEDYEQQVRLRQIEQQYLPKSRLELHPKLEPKTSFARVDVPAKLEKVRAYIDKYNFGIQEFDEYHMRNIKQIFDTSKGDWKHFVKN